MTYIPVSHQLVSHEDAVAAEFETNVARYLWREWLAKFMADWRLTLPEDGSLHNSPNHNRFRNEYLGEPMELDDRVFDRALLRESMHAKELLEEFIAGINFEEAMRGFVGVLPSTQVLYIEMPYIEITFNLGPVQDEHGNEQAPAQT